MSLQDFNSIEDNIEFYKNQNKINDYKIASMEKNVDRVITNLKKLISKEVSKKKLDIYLDINLVFYIYNLFLVFSTRIFQYIYMLNQQNLKLITYKVN